MYKQQRHPHPDAQLFVKAVNLQDMESADGFIDCWTHNCQVFGCHIVYDKWFLPYQMFVAHKDIFRQKYVICLHKWRPFRKRLYNVS